jgi:hypothetical protein
MTNARNQGIFSVTDIFLLNFLINMPKFQKIHFFLMLIYIIIGRESCVPKHFRGQTPGEMCRVTRPAGDKTPKRYRERFRFPAKIRRSLPAAGRKG